MIADFIAYSDPYVHFFVLLFRVLIERIISSSLSSDIWQSFVQLLWVFLTVLSIFFKIGFNFGWYYLYLRDNMSMCILLLNELNSWSYFDGDSLMVILF